MLYDEIDRAIRRRVGEMSLLDVRYTPDDVLDAIGDSLRSFKTRKVTGFSDLTLDRTNGAEAIMPEPSDDLSEILVMGAALNLLRSTYSDKIARGTLGVSWKSGLEEESTISLQAAYERRLQSVEADLAAQLLIWMSGSAGTRSQ